MGMKLLPKSEVEKARATDKKREIDEGMKLAQRIDNLRETAALEEGELEKFRKETIKTIHEDITTESQRLDELKKKVSDLETRRQEALKPIFEEQERLEQARKEHEETKLTLESKEKTVSERENAAGDIERRAADLLRKAELSWSRSDARVLESQELQNKAKLAIESAEISNQLALASRREVEVQLLHREEIVTMRENSATIKETDLTSREKTLADGWILLLDRQAMLESEIKRAQK